MSATATRVSLGQAQVVCTNLLHLIASYTERYTVCGSVRRREPDVGDLDIIAVPQAVPIAGLFEELSMVEMMDALNWRLDELCGQQVIRQWRNTKNQPCWGPKLKRFIFEGMDVQVQSVDADCFGLWSVVRTGPAGYSHAFVTPRSQQVVVKRSRNGTVVRRPGLLPSGFEIKGGFRLFRSGGFVPTPEEADVYEVLGMKYVEPWERR